MDSAAEYTRLRDMELQAVAPFFAHLPNVVVLSVYIALEADEAADPFIYRESRTSVELDDEVARDARQQRHESNDVADVEWRCSKREGLVQREFARRLYHEHLLPHLETVEVEGDGELNAAEVFASKALQAASISTFVLKSRLPLIDNLDKWTLEGLHKFPHLQSIVWEHAHDEEEEWPISTSNWSSYPLPSLTSLSIHLSNTPGDFLQDLPHLVPNLVSLALIDFPDSEEFMTPTLLPHLRHLHLTSPSKCIEMLSLFPTSPLESYTLSVTRPLRTFRLRSLLPTTPFPPTLKVFAPTFSSTLPADDIHQVRSDLAEKGITLSPSSRYGGKAQYDS
jgi:hypothetical protein